MEQVKYKKLNKTLDEGQKSKFLNNFLFKQVGRCIIYLNKVTEGYIEKFFCAKIGVIFVWTECRKQGKLPLRNFLTQERKLSKICCFVNEMCLVLRRRRL